MKILDLPLKKEWYNMIESGVKKEEYREMKPYWSKRLIGCPANIDWCREKGRVCERCSEFNNRISRQKWTDYTHIRFRYGYTKRTMLFELKGITIGKGKTEWGAPNDRDIFILKLGNKIKEGANGNL